MSTNKKAVLSSDGITVENTIGADADFPIGTVCPTEVGIGWTYESNIWWCEKPYPSWVKQTGGAAGSIGVWEAPVDRPEGDQWAWDEDTLSWIDVSPS